MAAEQFGNGGQEHQRQNHGQVFDDQPADSDAAAGGIEEVPLFQGLQQHDGARDRQGEAEDDPSAKAPPPPFHQPDAEQGHDGDSYDRARHRDAAYGQQIGGGKMQADAEHQQDDAHLRQLAGKGRIRYEAWR